MVPQCQDVEINNSPKLRKHGILHDLSIFRSSEFFSYARFFHAKNRTSNYRQSDEIDSDFQKGRCHHKKRNKHHWNYWVSVTRKNKIQPIPMPEKYVKQMIADWRGISRKFGGTAREYYEKNRDFMILQRETIGVIERTFRQ
ncbi:MAG: hypothetical protein HQ561_00880 [Desulfobacteraceae bacterium]|nr:hypothetical protein [Desulfobacteraceae bacterium]